MASTAGPFPIFYTPDVHNFYVKQKHEFHFNQKSDNEFLMFLLDTAVRVISIVQHLAPVIEAVSEASADIDDMEEDMSPAETPLGTSSANLSGTLDVDTAARAAPLPLSAELEQINQEITNAQISSQQRSNHHYPNTSANRRLPSQQSFMTSEPEPMQGTVVPVQNAPMQTDSIAQQSSSTNESADLQSEPLFHPTPSIKPPLSLQPSQIIQSSSLPTPIIQTSSITASSSVVFPETSNSDSLAPNVPMTLFPSSAQSSENLFTNIPSVRQPIAEAPSSNEFKSEQPVPEIIEIKEEMDDPLHQTSPAELIPPETLQHLMSSISGTEDRSGLQNFVPTATPSSLPPSFLDRGSNNPLSMVGSMNSGDGPGPSGINVPNISESMMKNINDAGLNVASIKGQANPNFLHACVCPTCQKSFACPDNVKVHINTVHKKLKASSCKFCGKSFGQHSSRSRHEKNCKLKTENYSSTCHSYIRYPFNR